MNWWKVIAITFIILTVIVGTLGFCWWGPNRYHVGDAVARQEIEGKLGMSVEDAKVKLGSLFDDGYKAAYQEVEGFIKGLGFGTLEEAKAALEQLATAKPLSPPEIVGEVSYQELIDLLNEKFPDSRTWKVVSKSHYNLTSIEEIKRFLDWDKTNEIPYTNESSDFIVPDYTFRVIGRMIEPNGWSTIPVGFVWGVTTENEWRFWNIFVTREEGKLIFYLTVPWSDEITSRHVSGLGKIIFPEKVEYIALVWIK